MLLCVCWIRENIDALVIHHDNIGKFAKHVSFICHIRVKTTHKLTSLTKVNFLSWMMELSRSLLTSLNKFWWLISRFSDWGTKKESGALFLFVAINDWLKRNQCTSWIVNRNSCSSWIELSDNSSRRKFYESVPHRLMLNMPHSGCCATDCVFLRFRVC